MRDTAKVTSRGDMRNIRKKIKVLGNDKEGKSIMNFVKIIFPTKVGLGDMNIYQYISFP